MRNLADYIVDNAGVLTFDASKALAHGFTQAEIDAIDDDIVNGDTVAATGKFNTAVARIEAAPKADGTASYKFVQVGQKISGWVESPSVFARLLTASPRVAGNSTFEYEVELSNGDTPRVSMTKKQHDTFGSNLSTGAIVTCVPRQGKKDVTSREMTAEEYAALKGDDKVRADKAQKGLQGRPLVYLLGDTRMTYRFGGVVTGDSLESARTQFIGAAEAKTVALGMKLTMSASMEALNSSSAMIVEMQKAGVDPSIIASTLSSLIALTKKA